MTREKCWNTHSVNLMDAFSAFGLDEVEILVSIADNANHDEVSRDVFRDTAIACGEFFQNTLREFRALKWDEDEDVDFMVLSLVLQYLQEKSQLKKRFDFFMNAKLELGEAPTVDDMITDLIFRLYDDHIKTISEIGAEWTDCIIESVDLTGDDAFDDDFRSGWT